MHNLKVENSVLFGGLTEDSSPAGSLSDGSEGLLRRGKGGLLVNAGCGSVNYIALDLKNKGMQMLLHSEFWYTIQSYLLVT